MKKPTEPKYVIGIDLGTTNSALAYAELRSGADPFDLPKVELVAIPQLTNPGEMREQDLLPSFLYLAGKTDFPEGSLALPWGGDGASVVGRLAQKRGVENAGRLVSSAKSWLSHAGVDRTSPLLPYRAPEGVPKVSPVGRKVSSTGLSNPPPETHSMPVPSGRTRQMRDAMPLNLRPSLVEMSKPCRPSVR